MGGCGGDLAGLPAGTAVRVIIRRGDGTITGPPTPAVGPLRTVVDRANVA
jgi:hypothetical protein